MTFGTRLRKHREKKRFSQREVAQLLGVSQTTYYNWEADVTSCRVKFLTKLAQVLELDMAELIPGEMTGKGITNPQQKKQNKSSVSFETNRAAHAELYTELLLSKDEIIRLLKDENALLKNRNAQLEERKRLV